MIQLKSEVLKLADYDEAAERLTLRFVSGDTYTYDKVPRETFLNLTRAESAGKFFHEHIRLSYVGAKQEEEAS